jgi:hypothetical protein
MGVRSYNSKVVISGDIVEVYEYENSILEGFDIKEFHDCGRGHEASEKDKQINRDKVYTRAKQTLRRLINVNIGEYAKFVTLTFAENITDIKLANYEFKKFRQRLEDYLHRSLQYVCVIEFQKRGAIHYHLLMFNVPYIANLKLREIWGNGFVKINNIDNVDNVGAYVCKYMTKCEDDRLLGKKMYFSSRSLEKPVEIKEKEEVNNLAAVLPLDALTYESTFTNEYNSITYKQYNMKKLEEKEEVSQGLCRENFL